MNTNMNVILCLQFLCFFLLSTLFIKASAINVETYESDRIIDLPGQPSSPSVSHFSGYITVNENHGRTLFYWLFEAQSEPSKKPLLLWLNGGLHFNTYSWNQANLLFVESPVGVGFFYTNTSSDFTILEDNFVAEDTYNFLVNWLQRFPQFKSREFFISGESYGGHYIPQLAELIFDRNKDRNKYPSINLKGFIVGNPETGDYYDYKGVLEYAWSHAVISDQQYDKAKQLCDFKQFDWPNECNKAMNEVFLDYSEIDIFNIYAPACRLNSTSSIADHSNSNNPESSTKERNDYRLRMRIFGGYDPCYSNYAEEYFNIRRGTNVNVTWKVCNLQHLCFWVLPIYTKLIKGGLKIWIYRIVEYEGLTYVTVRGAGHMVPLKKPSEALSLIQHLPTTRG
ncbi:hypothetical protein AAZV13_17G033100 [Glycine max]